MTDGSAGRTRELPSLIGAALRGGVGALQLREKQLSARAQYELAGALLPACRHHSVPLLINDRIDIALAIGADGVHLPSNGCAPADARSLLGPERLLMASTHSLAEARAAAAGGVDAVVFGPIFDTPSKRRFGAPLGVAALEVVTRALRIPVLAIGGITAERVAAVRAAGAYGIAVIGAIMSADDPAVAAARLRAAICG